MLFLFIIEYIYIKIIPPVSQLFFSVIGPHKRSESNFFLINIFIPQQIYGQMKTIFKGHIHEFSSQRTQTRKDIPKLNVGISKVIKTVAIENFAKGITQ